MGGILGAEVALLPPNSQPSRFSFRHRILGTLNFDTPFLGLHPGVIVSGIGSLFRKDGSPDPNPQVINKKGDTMSPTMQEDLTPISSISKSSPNFSPATRASTLDLSTDSPSPLSALTSPTPMSDPHYNPSFPNDVRVPVREKWDSALHFLTKHAGGLSQATRSYVTSHLEFGGCLADYVALQRRYAKLRPLEDVDALQRDQSSSLATNRLRFVNYYTASTGRIKHPKIPAQGERGRISRRPSETGGRSSSRSPQISAERAACDEGNNTSQETDGPAKLEEQENRLSTSDEEMTYHAPTPFADDRTLDISNSTTVEDDVGALDGILSTPSPPATSTAPERPPPLPPTSTSLLLPPIPNVPLEPAPFDSSLYPDKETRKLCEKTHLRQVKTYKQAVKDRDKAIADRIKFIAKLEKKSSEAQEKSAKQEEKDRLKEQKRVTKNLTKSAELHDISSKMTKSDSPGFQGDEHVAEKVKAKHDKKFCMLPAKGPTGERDTCWVRVFMEGVDEVGAHCGLFFANKPHYESLVSAVGAKIDTWIREATHLTDELR